LSGGIPNFRLPGVTTTPGVNAAMTPNNTLPGWPGTGGGSGAGSTGSTPDPRKTFVITHYGAALKQPSIGPNGNPAIPTALADIDYKPLATSRLGATIPPGYGRYAIGGNLVRVKNWPPPNPSIPIGSDIIAVVVWGEGELDAIEEIYSGNVDIKTYTGVAHYLGADSQTPDPDVEEQFGQADALNGIAYSVLQLYPGLSLDLWAIVRGRKVYDPRSETTAYSNNAALCAADFADHFTDYTVNADTWATVETCADYCDDWVDDPTDTIRRWQVNMPLATPKPPDEWLDILCEYANCYWYTDDGVIKFVPDHVRDVDHVLTASDVRAGTLELRKSAQRDTPTQVVADYTVPAAEGPWGTDTVYTDDPGEGVPLRVTPLQLLGYQEKTQALRKAKQWLNYATLSDLFCTFDTFDNGATIVRGDVIALTHPIGLTSEEFRVLDCSPVPGEKGRWRISGRKYSDALYPDDVEANPELPASDFPPVDSVRTVDLKKYSGQNVQSGTSYTLEYADAGFPILMTSSDANTLTIPHDDDELFDDNTRIEVIQGGAGLTTIVGDTGVTVHGDSISQGQNKAMSLWKRGTNTWYVFGGTT